MCRTGRSVGDFGFTLIELLVVMTLLSIVVVVALAWVPGLADSVAVDRSAKQIERALLQTVALAKTSGSDQVITFNVTTEVPTMVVGTRAIELDPSIEMRWVGASDVGASSERSAIAFLAIGGSSGGTIELRRGAAVARLEIDWLTGGVHERVGER